MNQLSNLELSLLDKLSNKYHVIKSHIPHLVVTSRELTGVGMYINFEYKDYNSIQKINPPNAAISTNELIHVDVLEFGLGYEVTIENGLLTFIELVTYGEDWDGTIGTYQFKA